MRSNQDELLKLLELLEITNPEEIDCEEFLARSAAFLEKPENTTAPCDDAFLHHLRVCPECFEEFVSLYRALRNEEWSPPSEPPKHSE